MEAPQAVPSIALSTLSAAYVSVPLELPLVL
jgi:hypothetical protein